MSAQLFPSSSTPPGVSLTVLPPADPVTVTSSGPSGNGLPEAVKVLLRNPIVLAGGAVVAGVVLSRFFAIPAARRMARQLAEEAIRQLKPTAVSAATAAAGMAGTAVASSVLERGVEKFGPQITDFAKKMLADILRKKE